MNMTGEVMIIAIDFDGVINGYKGFKGKGKFEPPVPGAYRALTLLKEAGHTIIINTTRSETWLVEDYLRKNGIPFDHINTNPENAKRHLSPSKVLADIYIDDRNIPFDGNWSRTLGEIEVFKPWWKQS